MNDQNNDEGYLNSLREQLNKIKEERDNKLYLNQKDEEINKNEKEDLLNNIFNEFNNMGQILNRSKTKEEIEEENKKLYPKDENDEDEQYKLALKESEEEAKRQLEKEKEEEEEFQKAIEESKKYYNNNNYNNNNEKEEEFDEEYGICPITQEYMENPVITPSGNYYEKSAIIDWINKNQSDPLSREYLTVEMLVEDNEYKKQIIEYRKKFNK